MIQTKAIVTKKESIAPAWWQITLSAPSLGVNLQPGQFFQVRCGSLFNSYLRRSIFPQRLADDSIALLLWPSPDPGLAWLLARQEGDTLDIIGPLGRGFPLPDSTQNLLLVSDVPLSGVLLGQLHQAIEANYAVTLALEAHRAAGLYPTRHLPPAVELQITTRDGSHGHHGPIAALLPELLHWADLVCAVGSSTLYHTLQQQSKTIRITLQSGYLYGLISPGLFACGWGACLGCTIETERGLKLPCLDGPVFDLSTLTLEGMSL